jgi:hypothetical protein
MKEDKILEHLINNKKKLNDALVIATDLYNEYTNLVHDLRKRTTDLDLAEENRRRAFLALQEFLAINHLEGL